MDYECVKCGYCVGRESLLEQHYREIPVCQVAFLVVALKGFLHADPDVFRDELETARAAIKTTED